MKYKKSKLLVLLTVAAAALLCVAVFAKLPDEDIVTDIADTAMTAESERNETFSELISDIAETEELSEQTEATAESPAETDEETLAETDAENGDHISYTFRNEDLYESHYQKHGAEFGDITKEEYLRMANDLINSDSPDVLHKTEKEDGDYLYYDQVTNEFLVLSTDGYIRTYFKPDSGMDYWERQ